MEIPFFCIETFMRPASQDIQWITNGRDEVVGLSLGHDMCAEHEWGVKALHQALGLTGGLGVEGRTATQAAPFFRFETYKHSLPKERGSLKAPEKWPAAVLCVKAYTSDWDTDPTDSVLDLVKNYRLRFLGNPGDRWYKSERDNISTAWSQEGFIIHVRGEENVKHLTELAQLFRKNDLALADPHVLGFSRSGLSVVAPSRMLPEEKAKVMEDDVAMAKLVAAAKATGIEEVLKDAGKHYYALSPAWTDESQTAVRFYLNPREQKKFNFGWYTVDQLKAWANDAGPILKEPVISTPSSAPKPRMR